MSAGLTAGAIVIIFLSTAAGAAVVFFFGGHGSDGKVNAVFSGFASGIMVAASVWSLIIPAIEESEGWSIPAFLPAAVGIAAGGLLIMLLDFVVYRLRRRSAGGLTPHGKLLLAMTVHNIPEGLSVGLALGAALPLGDAAVLSAFGLAAGIAVQNFPEGAAAALPLRGAGMSAKKSFLLASASGAVEPLFAGIGLLLASFVRPLQPWLLGLSAGAMIFVVAEELIPGSRSELHPHAGAIGFIVGFVLMMVLDVAL